MKLRISALFCFLLALSVCSAAQQSLSLSGTVVDTTNAIIPGITVTLLNARGGEVAHTASGSDGKFTFRNLAAGKYTLHTEQTLGFAPSSLDLNLTAKATGITLAVPLATVTQSVTVGEEQTLTTDAADNKDTIAVSSNSLEQIPVFDQDYIATLLPFLDQGSLSTGGASIVVDGIEVANLGISASAVQEIRINNDPYSTEFNRPGRARLEIITKQASPQYHGALNFIFRDAALNAANYFAPVKPSEQRRIYEGSILGPLFHFKHMGFLISGTLKEQDSNVVVNAAGFPLQNISAPIRETHFTFRIGKDFSDTHQSYWQYEFEDYTQLNENVGGLVAAQAGSNNYNPEHHLVFNDRLTLTPHLVNQFGLRLEKETYDTLSATNAQKIIVDGAFTAGGAQADIHRAENTIRFNEVLSWNHGVHDIRIGMNVPQLSRRGYDDHQNRLGTFEFDSPAAYATNTPDSFTYQQGPGRTVYWINELGTFIQDQIKLSPRLSVSLGLRWDWQSHVHDFNNVAPRISAALALDKSGKTLLRTGTGIFYDRTGGDTLGYIFGHNGVAIQSFVVTHPCYPNPFAPGCPTAPPALVQFAANVRIPYAVQYSAAIERKLSAKATLTIGYRGSVGVGNFRSRDTNAPLGPTYTTRPNPAFSRLQTIESEGRQLTNAMDVNFQGSVGRWFTGQAQYTLGRIRNNTEGLYFYAQDQYRPSAEWGRDDRDRTHRLNLLGNINPGHWLSLGVALTAYSALPYDETSGLDPFNTGLGNARPAGVGRNALSGGSNVSLDLRWSHDWTLGKAKGENAKVFTAGVDSFDVLNHPNFTNYVGNVQSPFFGQPTTANPDRQMQLSVRFKF